MHVHNNLLSKYNLDKYMSTAIEPMNIPNNYNREKMNEYNLNFNDKKLLQNLVTLNLLGSELTLICRSDL